MARPFLLKWLTHLRLIQHRRRSGFTLIELLVAMLIGSLITVLLLGIVVELTQTNARDSGRSQVQQDMQAALDYIAQDLREAVFVYNGECLFTTVPGKCSGLVNYIPEAMNTGAGGRVPVLAFWRTDPLPPAIRARCSVEAPNLVSRNDAVRNAVPRVLRQVCIAGSTYTLVVYAIDTSNGAPEWRGNARLVRYSLSQFRDNAANENDVNVGYVNPLETATMTFQQWPLDGAGANRQNTAGGRPTGGAPVLVDFVDNTATTPTCPDFDGTGAVSPPSNASGFYACVRYGGPDTSLAQTGKNQDVMLTLVGNPSGLSSFPKQHDNQNRLSPIQTRVLVRGIIKKR